MYCLGSYGFSFAKVESNKEHDKDELEWWSPQENNRHQAVVQFFVQQSSICCWSSKPWTVGTVSPWRLKGLTCLWSTSGRRWARQDSSISFPFWDVGRKRLTGAFSVDFACMLKVCAAILFGKDSLKLLCSSFSRVNKSSESSCQKMELPNVSRKHHDLGLMRFPFLSRFFCEAARAIADSYWLSKSRAKENLFRFWFTSLLVNNWTQNVSRIFKIQSFLSETFPKHLLTWCFFGGKRSSVWSKNFEVVHSFILIGLQGKVLPTIRRKLMAKAPLEPLGCPPFP